MAAAAPGLIVCRLVIVVELVPRCDDVPRASRRRRRRPSGVEHGRAWAASSGGGRRWPRRRRRRCRPASPCTVARRGPTPASSGPRSTPRRPPAGLLGLTTIKCRQCPRRPTGQPRSRTVGRPRRRGAPTPTATVTVTVAPDRDQATTRRPVGRGQAPRRSRPPVTPASAAASAAVRARPASTTSPASAPSATVSTAASPARARPNGTACPRSPPSSASPTSSRRAARRTRPVDGRRRGRRSGGRSSVSRSSLARIGATEATVWPASRFITRTPVASRPCEEISRTGMRMVTPPDDTATISSSRPTMNAATTWPLRAGELDADHALAAAALAVEAGRAGCACRSRPR